jgi:hypothetical protein
MALPERTGENSSFLRKFQGQTSTSSSILPLVFELDVELQAKPYSSRAVFPSPALDRRAQAMGSLKDRTKQARKAILARYNTRRLRSDAVGAPQAGNYAGASDATFLQPLPQDAPSGRLSPPPKVFDPSSLNSMRKRSRSLSPPPKPVAKSDLAPFQTVSSPRPGLICKS